jgi:hypothetical protein
MKLSEVMNGLGWICFALALIWPTGALISAFLFPPSFDAANTGIALWAFVWPSVFFALATPVLIWGSIFARARHSRSILAHGIPAEAKILKLSETGTTINDRPLVRFLLEVHPADRPAFQVETEKVISILDIPRIQPGTIVPVRYDPSSNAVALVWPTQ